MKTPIEYIYFAGEYSASIPETNTFQFRLLSSANTQSLSHLYGKQIWVVVERKRKKFLYASAVPVLIETSTSENGEEISIINVDELRSTYFLSATEHSKNSSFDVSDFLDNDLEVAITPLSEKLGNQFRTTIKKASTFSFKVPTRQLMLDIGQFKNTNKQEILALEVFRVAKKKFSMADLNRNAKHREFDEFQNFTYQWLKVNTETEDTKLRPLVNSLSWTTGTITSRLRPQVDSNFREILTDAIRSRSFISPDTDSTRTYQDMLLATEKAEKRHQEILKDVSEHLISKGWKPLESSSVDLALECNNFFAIFEIKSANSTNFFHQCEKGLAQILRYSFELDQKGNRLKSKSLIIERCQDEYYEKFIEDFLEYCGIRVLFYDSTKNWPDRLYGLENSLS